MQTLWAEKRLVEKIKNDFGQPCGNKENNLAGCFNNVEMEESISLREVVAKGGTENLKILLERGVDVLQVFEGGNTTLHVAAARGQSATADILIHHCQNRNRGILQNLVNATNDDGSTPLHVAVDVKTVKCLLQHSALYDSKNKANRTPLDMSQDEEIRSLLETVEDLFSCVQNGKYDDVVGKIKALDSDVAVAATRARNSSGKTLLLVALQTNQKDLAEELGKWLKEHNWSSLHPCIDFPPGPPTLPGPHVDHEWSPLGRMLICGKHGVQLISVLPKKVSTLAT
ncbi:hypothetical protein CEXT_727771 [Caerostris extrusa]|uniref:Uncharacterized protein n=1 Tax=Caerostris extrusa TaxID=172846 RepID=A0AAV4XN36_CAEEX|nr:hypothetical protein CEXT_727771 [Caerostris extrusa]